MYFQIFLLTEISESGKQLGGEGWAGFLEQNERRASGAYHHQAAAHRRGKCSDTGQQLQNSNWAQNQSHWDGWGNNQQGEFSQIQKYTLHCPAVYSHLSAGKVRINCQFQTWSLLHIADNFCFSPYHRIETRHFRCSSHKSVCVCFDGRRSYQSDSKTETRGGQKW